MRVGEQVWAVPEGDTDPHRAVVTRVDGVFIEVIWATSTCRPEVRPEDKWEASDRHDLKDLGLDHPSYYYVDSVERPRHETEVRPRRGLPRCPPRIFPRLRRLAERGRVAHYDRDLDECDPFASLAEASTSDTGRSADERSLVPQTRRKPPPPP